MTENIIYRGQQGEDMIAWELLKDTPNGYYVDVGAFDGITISNTLIFEQQGWNGVCFEADAENFKELQKHRKCSLFQIAIGESIGETSYESNSPGRLSALSKRSVHATAPKVLMSTLNYALANLGINHVDYMSIDVDDYEAQVLAGFDIKKYNPRLVVIETNHNSLEYLYAYFDKNNYILGRQHYFNAFYVRNQADADVIKPINPNMENGMKMN